MPIASSALISARCSSALGGGGVGNPSWWAWNLYRGGAGGGGVERGPVLLVSLVSLKSLETEEKCVVGGGGGNVGRPSW